MKHIGFINKLEGYHLIMDGIHWSAEKNHTHELSDEVNSAILKYRDRIAENVMGVLNARIKKEQLSCTIPSQTINSLHEALESMLNDTMEYRESWVNDNRLIGLINILDEFISDINKWKYLSTFSD